MRYRYLRTVPAFLLFMLTLLPVMAAEAAEGVAKTSGQTVYVPAYSHIYHGNKNAELLLSVTLSLRNTDPDHPITITAVDYYDTRGHMVKQFITAPLRLGPYGSDRFIIPQDDKSGGSGANFIVKWQAAAPANPPIFETVMIGTQSQLGISFTSRGQALQN